MAGLDILNLRNFKTMENKTEKPIAVKLINESEFDVFKAYYGKKSYYVGDIESYNPLYPLFYFSGKTIQCASIDSGIGKSSVILSLENISSLTGIQLPKNGIELDLSGMKAIVKKNEVTFELHGHKQLLFKSEISKVMAAFASFG